MNFRTYLIIYTFLALALLLSPIRSIAWDILDTQDYYHCIEKGYTSTEKNGTHTCSIHGIRHFSTAPTTPSNTSTGTGSVIIERSTAPLPAQVLLDVPFISQAPSGNWEQPFQDACEEAAVLMVDQFLDNDQLSIPEQEDLLRAYTAYHEQQGFGTSMRTSNVATHAQDFFERSTQSWTDEEVTIDHIKHLLAAGYPVIVPAQGQELQNPYFTAPGPPYHMLTIIGYTPTHFITNDPGTRRGKHYPYQHELLIEAIHDWTGSDNTVKDGPKAMLIMK